MSYLSLNCITHKRCSHVHLCSSTRNISSFPLPQEENHLEFSRQLGYSDRIIHHIHVCSHDDAPNALGFHTFTLCSAIGTSNSTDRLSHCIIIWSSSQIFEWRRSSLRSNFFSGRNHVPFLGAFSQVCKLEKDSHSCNDPHLTGL